jgi:hypothetical protein
MTATERIRLTPELARTLAGLRYGLCEAVLWGERVDLFESERRKAYDKAKAFAQAIVITLGAHGLTGPTTPYTTPYLGGCPRLQPDDEQLAREVLGTDADRILGEAPRSTSTHTDTTVGTARRRRPAGRG